MTITYADGNSTEAVLLSRTENTLRLAVEGAEDVLELSNIGGTWVSAECEPVSVQYAWQRRKRMPEVSEADCHCSQDLAAKLVALLYTNSGEPSQLATPPAEYHRLAIYC